MADIDIAKLSKEITDKYQITGNTFALVAKTDVKDKIEVEIGDSKQPNFKPQVKIIRWDNEVNFSVRLKDEDTINTATVSTDKDKIIWEKGNIKIENYDYTEDEGGYKFVWYLKEKPLTNKVEFTIQSKGLDFFYQPELTAEEIAEGTFRPENVVGSYAVYHQTKGGMNDSAGKEYKCGKAFHIYRPHIIDANGAETWGNLHIENGIYSVEIPQDFLDKAVYPIKSNDTIGNTVNGGSNNSMTADRAYGVGPYTAAGSGTVTNMKFDIESGTQAGNVKGFITGTDEVIITNGISNGQATVANTNTVTFGTNPTITSGVGYEFWVISSASPDLYYDNLADGGFLDSTNSYATPSNPTSPNVSSRYTIYATYTAAPAGDSWSVALV